MRIVFPLKIIDGDKWFFFSPSSVNEIGSRRNNLRLDFLIFRGLYSGCAAVLGYSEITLLSNSNERGAEQCEVLGYSEITLLSNGLQQLGDTTVRFRLL